MERYFWTRELLGALHIVPREPFPIPVQKVGSAATTLSSSPENSFLSISVFYKKVEAPFLLVVGDQEGVFLIQWPEKAKKGQRDHLFFISSGHCNNTFQFRERC